MVKINVLMCAHNEERFIAKTIDSLLKQTFKDYNIIIIDDGSRDKTPDILKKYQKKYPKKIQVHILKVNVGLTKALNYGLLFCDAKYIARADANDFYHNTRLKTQYDFLEKNPKVAVVGTWREEWWPDTNETRKIKLPISNSEIQRDMIKRNCIGHSTTMIRGDILREFKYDARRRFSQDSELWARIGKKYAFSNIPKYLTTISRFEGSVTASKKKWDVLKSELLIRSKAYKNLKCPRWYFIFLVMPIIIFIIPKWLIEIYINLKPSTEK